MKRPLFSDKIKKRSAVYRDILIKALYTQM